MSARERPPRLARWILTLIPPQRYRDNQLVTWQRSSGPWQYRPVHRARAANLPTAIPDTGTLMVVGAAIGILGALLMTPILESMVVGISPRDPVTFIGVPAALMLVAVVANYIPAFRATRVDPMRAMREK